MKILIFFVLTLPQSEAKPTINILKANQPSKNLITSETFLIDFSLFWKKIASNEMNIKSIQRENKDMKIKRFKRNADASNQMSLIYGNICATVEISDSGVQSNQILTRGNDAR